MRWHAREAVFWPLSRSDRVGPPRVMITLPLMLGSLFGPSGAAARRRETPIPSASEIGTPPSSPTCSALGSGKSSLSRRRPCRPPSCRRRCRRGTALAAAWTGARRRPIFRSRCRARAPFDPAAPVYHRRESLRFSAPFQDPPWSKRASASASRRLLGGAAPSGRDPWPPRSALPAGCRPARPPAVASPSSRGGFTLGHLVTGGRGMFFIMSTSAE